MRQTVKEIEVNVAYRWFPRSETDGQGVPLFLCAWLPGVLTKGFLFYSLKGDIHNGYLLLHTNEIMVITVPALPLMASLT